MNKWLFVTLLSLSVISLTFKVTDVETAAGKSNSNTGNNGIKQYVLTNTRIISFRLILFFKSVLFVVFKSHEFNVAVLRTVVHILVDVKSIIQKIR